ncbi:flagellar transcriptional regulator FlhD [Achromobacter xylosoxidans]|uniref:flagellar transcriptional regulator FlhD n=1 Tax=Achromobacter ruhlandii TaxID=72557 RepID=UPI003B9D896A
MKPPVDNDLLGAIYEVNLMYLQLLQKMVRQGQEGMDLREDVKAWLSGRSAADLARLAHNSTLVCSMSCKAENVLAVLAKDMTADMAGLRWKRDLVAAPVLVATA